MIIQERMSVVPGSKKKHSKQLAITLVMLAQVETVVCAPVAQAITASSVSSTVDLYLGSNGSGSMTLHQPATVDVRSGFSNQCQPRFEAIPVGLGGLHTFTGRVRVKWIGKGAPSTTVPYGAVFDVWSIRQVTAHSTTVRPISPNGARTLKTDSSISGTFVSFLQKYETAVYPGGPLNPNDTDGDHVGTPLENIALPTSQYDANWTYMSNYVSSALFSWQNDGYYANVDFNSSVAYQLNDAGTPATSYPYWDSTDMAQSSATSRIIFKLATVAGEPVAL
ncbi:MAG TPA: hypothetical protein PLX06_06290 [Fimbriimonadaceae bacterium]|nr:hypothetical protein [Fimbriimonadaceae bacterium]